MIVKDIIDIMQAHAPDNLALEFDNVGLLVGDASEDVRGIAVSLDVTDECINKCIADNVNLIIVHHPIIFNPIKSVTGYSYVGDLLIKLIKNNINVYVSHTNMDNAEVGINYTLAKMLGVRHVNNFMQDGLGAYGKVDAIAFEDFCEKIRVVTGDKTIRCYCASKQVNNIAIISGAGGRDIDVIDYVKSNKIDTFISGEFKYNIILELKSIGVNVVDVSHYECEKVFVDIVYDILKKMLISGIDVQKYYLCP